jgi:hypothetical protein
MMKTKLFLLFFFSLITMMNAQEQFKKKTKKRKLIKFKNPRNNGKMNWTLINIMS